MSGRDRLDPDELALLEEERDHLLASLEDLEREFAAGDMDRQDYEALKDDYTVRTSEVLRSIEEHRAPMRREPRPVDRRRTLVVTVAVLVFALVAGVLVAGNAGQRGDGPISGGINNLRAQLARCQTTSFQDPEAGIDCYDDLLADAPGNVEALTYQGWAMIRAERISDGADNLNRAVEIDPDYPDARVFRAIVAARGGEYEIAATEIDRFYANDPAPAAIQILQSQGLEREIFVRLLDEGTQACWLEAAEGVDTGEAGEDEVPQGGETAAQFVEGLGACLDQLLATGTASADALVSRAYALLAPGDGDLERGAELAERAVQADPQDPNALLMRASVAVADGRIEEAEADLATLAELPRPTISFLIGGPPQVREAIDRTTDAQGSTTTTTRPESSSPSIPNPDGG